MEVRPSLAIENVDIGFYDENSREISDTGRPIRLKAPNKMVNEEARVEKALQGKYQRSGHLGELRKRRSYVQDLIESPSTQEDELEDALARCEEAFHNFVDGHDNYLCFEDDVEKKELINDCQLREPKRLEIAVRYWCVNGGLMGKEQAPHLNLVLV
ncbi:hypothetical protein P5673_032477 [Acropora cervicornis]|uniref:Uncharacterized protein n=1 Tax=Acropora cervicornis TaxID=6130 RepID=A0AAD9URR5_ACRCE|nr:hypothetical protein P5673_032477 [Acropora cervicornis]